MRIREVTRTLPGAPRSRNSGTGPERDGLWQRALAAAEIEAAERAGSPRAAGWRPDDDARPVRPRHYLPFIAQLAAGRIGLPQTRQRRRASPGDAREGYETADHLSTAPYLGTQRKRAL